MRIIQAYILVQTEVGLAASLAREIRGITGVTESQDVTGPHDEDVRPSCG